VPEWAEQVDADSGEPYYVNAATGESQWERPAALKPKPATTHAIKTEHVAAAVDKALQSQAPAKRKRASLTPSGGSEDEWGEFVDPSSGAKFYVNQKTGEKAWTKPGPDSAQPALAKDAWVRAAAAAAQES
jgi:outer membrane protein assembly factor BamB